LKDRLIELEQWHHLPKRFIDKAVKERRVQLHVFVKKWPFWKWRENNLSASSFL